MLIAMLILVGVAVLLMAIIWLTTQVFLTPATGPVELVDIGDGDGFLAGGMELEGPIEEEVGLETELDEPAVQDTLAAIADAVGAQAALLDDPALTDQMRSGRGGGSRGDGRTPGHGSGSGGGVSRNWKFRFIKVSSLQIYARQLDFFKIELGVVIPGGKVQYAFNVSKARPDSRIGPSGAEKRYYMSWDGDSELKEADTELLRRAGIESQGRLQVKFIPPELESDLYGKEKAYAGDRSEAPENVRTTWFRVVEQGNGYSFVVADQSYK